MQKAIDEDLEEGLVSAPFSESEIRMEYPKVLLNPPWAETNDLTRPDVRTLVDSTHGGENRHIHHAIQTTSPSLADAMRAIKGLKKPAAAKFDGRKAHRRALTPSKEHGAASTMWPSGLFYANAVGAFGVVYDGENWDRLASDVHRWALKLVGGNDPPRYYFPTTPWF